MFEHGVVEICPRVISGKGLIYLSSEAEPQEVPTRDQIHTFEAKACSLDDLRARNTRSVADDESWTSFGKWNVTLDKCVWPPNTERTEPEDPMDGGTFEDGYWAQQVEVPAVRLNLVDSLQDQINQKYSQGLGNFYDVTSQMKDGEQTYSVQFKRAPMVPFVSDANPDINKTFGVGFQSDLGIDITLPSLFQEMTFTMDALYESFTGYFFEYDPTMRGYKGNRHLVQGTVSDSDTVKACRAKISHAYAAISKPGEAHIISNQQLQPSALTESLLPLSAPSLEDLVRFTGYEEKSVRYAHSFSLEWEEQALMTPTKLHNDSQLLIRSMMYYHMDENQREKILQIPKPTVPDELPAALADNLPDNLKTFFEDKYGPAFICRYVGRTQKYMKSFTDQEMKKLWYWWQGNGKDCLTQSEEYNDINRLSSREAMKRRYESNLQPYLADNPDDWATKLFTEVTNNKRLLLNWVHFPIADDGNIVVNKQCNILDALSPSSDWSQKFFDKFLAFATTHGASAADIEAGGGQDQKYNWLHDSMRDLIVAVLSDDPSISDEVKKGLQADIEQFEKENNLNQQADAQQRAAAILEKSTVFMQELAGWFTCIGKGLAAGFSGTALWKWVGKAFDTVAEKLSSSLPALGNLKGLSSLCMVGVGLATAAVSIWGLVNSWSTMADAQRAVVIFEVVWMVVGGVDRAINAFNSFKSKPASTPADEFNMEALNDGLAEEISENGSKLGDVAQEVAGDEDYRTVIADGIHGEGIATTTDGQESWNEALDDLGKDVPPGYEDLAKKFNISGNMLRVLNAILGIGLVVAMSFSLATNWSSMSDPGRVLGVLNIVVQGLTVLLDVVDVGTEMGLWAVTGTMSVAFPILGAVLAVIGVILMIVQLFINLFIGKQDPPDPIVDFVKDAGHSLIATFDAAPQPQLTYSISDAQVSAGKVSTVTTTGKNEGSDDVTLSHTDITLYSGDDNVCLFRNRADQTGNTMLVLDSDADKNKNGHTYVAPSSTNGAQLPTPSRLGNTSVYFEYNLKTAGPPSDTTSSLQNLILKAGESFQSTWTGMINNKGDDTERSTSWIEVVEVGLKDKCQSQFVLQRI
ncbi:hypothetical protein MANI_115552 [Metarhizium anisopliae]|nr:hypothetical protein MANI_115552 [Metarhizium anisopliae]